jgi:hypothetical protein
MIGKMEILEAKSSPSFIWKFTPHSDDQMAMMFPGDSRLAFAASILDEKISGAKTYSR